MKRQMGEYEVIGKRVIRGHKPGETFQAEMGAYAEARAIGRGDIRFIRHINPSIQPGSFSLPEGWLNQNEEVH